MAESEDSINKENELPDMTFDDSLTMVRKVTAGRVSPIKSNCMKDMEENIRRLQQENFDLRLLCYHLEQNQKDTSTLDSDRDYTLALEKQTERMTKDIEEKCHLLKCANVAIDRLRSEKEALTIELTKLREPVPNLNEIIQTDPVEFLTVALSEQIEQLTSEVKQRDLEIHDLKKQLDCSASSQSYILSAVMDCTKSVAQVTHPTDLQKGVSPFESGDMAMSAIDEDDFPLVDQTNQSNLQNEEIRYYQSKIVDLEAKLAELRNVPPRLLDPESNEEISKLRINYHKAGKAIAGFIQKLSKRDATISQLEAELKVSNEEKEEQIQSIVGVTVEQLKIRLSSEESRCHQLEQQVSTLRSQVVESQQLMASRTTELEALEAHIAALYRHLDSNSASNVSESVQSADHLVTNEVEVFSDEVMVDNCGTSSGEMVAMEAGNDVSDVHISRCSLLIDKLSNILKKKERRLVFSETSFVHVENYSTSNISRETQSTLDVEDVGSSQIDTTSGSVAGHQKTNTKQDTSSFEETSSDPVKELTTQCGELMSRIQELETESHRKNSEIDEMGSQCDELMFRIHELERLAQSNNSEIEELTSHCDEMISRINELENEVQTKQTEIEKLKLTHADQIEWFTSDSARKASELARISKEVPRQSQELEKQRTSLLDQVNLLQDQLDKELSTAEKRIDELTAQLEEVTDANDQLRQCVDQVYAHLTGAKTELYETQRFMGEQRQESEEREACLKEKMHQNENMIVDLLERLDQALRPVAKSTWNLETTDISRDSYLPSPQPPSITRSSNTSPVCTQNRSLTLADLSVASRSQSSPTNKSQDIFDGTKTISLDLKKGEDDVVMMAHLTAMSTRMRGLESENARLRAVHAERQAARRQVVKHIRDEDERSIRLGDLIEISTAENRSVIQGLCDQLRLLTLSAHSDSFTLSNISGLTPDKGLKNESTLSVSQYQTGDESSPVPPRDGDHGPLGDLQSVQSQLKEKEKIIDRLQLEIKTLKNQSERGSEDSLEIVTLKRRVDDLQNRNLRLTAQVESLKADQLRMIESRDRAPTSSLTTSLPNLINQADDVSCLSECQGNESLLSSMTNQWSVDQMRHFQTVISNLVQQLNNVQCLQTKFEQTLDRSLSQFMDFSLAGSTAHVTLADSSVHMSHTLPPTVTGASPEDTNTSSRDTNTSSRDTNTNNREAVTRNKSQVQFQLPHGDDVIESGILEESVAWNLSRWSIPATPFRGHSTSQQLGNVTQVELDNVQAFEELRDRIEAVRDAIRCCTSAGYDVCQQLNNNLLNQPESQYTHPRAKEESDLCQQLNNSMLDSALVTQRAGKETDDELRGEIVYEDAKGGSNNAIRTVAHQEAHVPSPFILHENRTLKNVVKQQHTIEVNLSPVMYKMAEARRDQERMHRQLDVVMAENTHLRAELEALRENEDGKETQEGMRRQFDIVMAENSDLRAEVETLREDEDGKESQAKDLLERLEKVEVDCEEEMRRLDHRLQEKTREAEQLQSQVSDLHSQCSSLEKALLHVRSAHLRLSRGSVVATTEVSPLSEASVEDLVRQDLEWKCKWDEMEREKERLSDNLDTMRIKLVTTKTEFERENSSLHQELTRLSSELDSVSEELEKRDDALRRLGAEYDEVIGDKLSLAEELARAIDSRDLIEKNLQTSELKNVELGQVLTTIRNKLSSAEAKTCELETAEKELNREIESLKSRLHSTEGDLEVTQREVDLLTHENGHMKEEMVKIETGLQEKVTQLEKESQSCNAEKAKISADFVESASLLATVQRENQKLQKDLSENSCKLASANQESNQLQKKITNLSLQLAETTTNLEAKLAEIEKVNKWHDKLSHDLSLIDEKLESKCQALQDAEKALETKTWELLESKKELEDNIQAHVSCKKTLEEKTWDLVECKRQLNDKTSDLSDAKQTVDAMTQEVAAARKEADICNREWEASSLKMEDDMCKLEASLDAKIEELEAVRAKFVYFEDVCSKADKLEAQLDQEIAEKKQVLEELNVVKEEKDGISKQLNAVKEEKQHILEQLNAVETKNHQISDQLSAVSQEKQWISERLDAVEEEKKVIADGLERTQKTLERTEMEIKREIEEVRHAGDEKEKNLISMLETKSKEIGALCKELDSISAELQSVQNSNDNLELELKHEKDNTARLESVVSKLELELKSKRTRSDTSFSPNVLIRDTQLLQNRVSSLLSQQENQKVYCTELKDKLTTRTNRLDQCLKENARLKALVEADKTRVHEMIGELTRLESEVRSKDERIQVLEQSLHNATLQQEKGAPRSLETSAVEAMRRDPGESSNFGDLSLLQRNQAVDNCHDCKGVIALVDQIVDIQLRSKDQLSESLRTELSVLQFTQHSQSMSMTLSNQNPDTMSVDGEPTNQIETGDHESVSGILTEYIKDIKTLRTNLENQMTENDLLRDSLLNQLKTRSSNGCPHDDIIDIYRKIIRERFKEHSNEMNKAQKQIAEATTKLALSTSRIASLETEVKAGRLALSQKEELLFDKDREVFNLRHELEEKKRSLCQLTNELELTKDQLSTLRSENTLLRQHQNQLDTLLETELKQTENQVTSNSPEVLERVIKETQGLKVQLEKAILSNSRIRRQLKVEAHKVAVKSSLPHSDHLVTSDPDCVQARVPSTQKSVHFAPLDPDSPQEHLPLHPKVALKLQPTPITCHTGASNCAFTTSTPIKKSDISSLDTVTPLTTSNESSTSRVTNRYKSSHFSTTFVSSINRTAPHQRPSSGNLTNTSVCKRLYFNSDISGTLRNTNNSGVPLSMNGEESHYHWSEGEIDPNQAVMTCIGHMKGEERPEIRQTEESSNLHAVGTLISYETMKRHMKETGQLLENLEAKVRQSIIYHTRIPSQPQSRDLPILKEMLSKVASLSSSLTDQTDLFSHFWITALPPSTGGNTGAYTRHLEDLVDQLTGKLKRNKTRFRALKDALEHQEAKLESALVNKLTSTEQVLSAARTNLERLNQETHKDINRQE